MQRRVCTFRNKIQSFFFFYFFNIYNAIPSDLCKGWLIFDSYKSIFNNYKFHSIQTVRGTISFNKYYTGCTMSILLTIIQDWLDRKKDAYFLMNLLAFIKLK